MKTITLIALLAALGWLCLAADAPDRRNIITVSGQAIPGSLTIPISTQNKALNASMTATAIVIANTGAVDQTITIQDCQGSPFILFNGYTIKAKTTWTLASPIPFSGCFKWSASDVSVMGTVIGQ